MTCLQAIGAGSIGAAAGVTVAARETPGLLEAQAPARFPRAFKRQARCDKVGPVETTYISRTL